MTENGEGVGEWTVETIGLVDGRNGTYRLDWLRWCAKGESENEIGDKWNPMDWGFCGSPLVSIFFFINVGKCLDLVLQI